MPVTVYLGDRRFDYRSHPRRRVWFFRGFEATRRLPQLDQIRNAIRAFPSAFCWYAFDHSSTGVCVQSGWFYSEKFGGLCPAKVFFFVV
jgi:hypothetical protein